MKGLQIVVLGSIVPDPLQTLEPVSGPTGPALKNELMLPAVLDPWAGHALYEAANLAKKVEGKVYLVALGPKAKLQQVMMNVAQKVPFEIVVLDGPASGFADAAETAAALAGGVEKIPGLDKSKLLVFGGWQSASRGTGAVLQMVGELLGITDQFQGVDEIAMAEDGSFTVLERIEGGSYQKSSCQGAPALLGWATGNLPEPPNNPQVGMQNMRLIMPALAKATPAPLKGEGLKYAGVELPSQRRETRVVKNAPVEDIARELADWIRA
ncbi:MAG: electron transfer flavoprotein subunit beta [Humidesulfovibrio sp.]|nr:electron transfer flavoprotein subunit beta [Humidesulfovibrio sp.]